MPTYEYICLSCEHPFEERRSMTGAVETALRCPRCGDERVRRRFSLFATGGAASSQEAPSAGGCCGGGGCACGG